MPSRSFISQPSAWAYSTTGMPRRRASRTSGFVSRIAAEVINKPDLVGNVLRAVPDGDADAAPYERFDDVAAAGVAAADRAAVMRQQGGDAAHADAADADQVHRRAAPGNRRRALLRRRHGRRLTRGYGRVRRCRLRPEPKLSANGPGTSSHERNLLISDFQQFAAGFVGLRRRLLPAADEMHQAIGDVLRRVRPAEPQAGGAHAREAFAVAQEPDERRRQPARRKSACSINSAAPAPATTEALRR